jgi:hypothetical protein
MKYIVKSYNDYINENSNSDKVITLYHGTNKPHADLLLKNGWRPNKVSSGSQQGQTQYLYLTTEYEDALWFANAKDSDIVLKVKVPLKYLKFDPEDGDGDMYGYDIEKALEQMKNTPYPMPIKLVSYKDIPKENISIHKP